MKILLVSSNVDSYYSKFISNLAKTFMDQGHIVYGLFGKSLEDTEGKNIKIVKDHDFEYLSQSLDEHRYLRVFKIANQFKIDIVHFLRITDPQRLYVALETYGQINFKIGGGMFGLPLFNQREIYTRYLFKLLLHLSHLILYSIYPPSLKKFAITKGLISDKIHFIYQPVYDDVEIYSGSNRIYARNKYGFKKNDFVALWFGSMFFGKGIDIFADSVQYLNKKVRCLIAGNPKTINFDFSDDVLKRNPQITFVDKFVPDFEVGNLFSASDLVVLSYRKTYKHDASGVLVQAIMARKLLVVPDFSPFAEIIKKYKLGVVFSAEDSKSLAKSINECRKNYSKYFSGAMFDEYINSIDSWDDITTIIATT